MAEVGTAFVTIVPSAKGFGAALNAQTGPALAAGGTSGGKKFGGGIRSGASSALKGFAGVFAAGVVVKGLKDVIGEAREAQKVGAVTAQVIKATGGAANVSASQVGKLATAISNKTGVDDEAIQKGSNLLLTFRNVRNETGRGADVFNQATQAAVDLAATGFGSIEGNSKLLGKALNDPVKGMTALTRAGVTFSAGQKKTIKDMVKSGDLLGAQKIILNEVQHQVGGTAAASATAGEKMKVAWNNAKESLGTALLPAIDKLQNAITTKVIPAIVKFIGFLQKNPAIVKAFAVAIGAIAAAFLIAFIAANAIVIGIGLLVAGLVYAYTQSETFRNIVNAVFAAIKAVVIVTIKVIVAVIKAGIAVVKGIWVGLKFLWAVIKGIFGIVVAVVKLHIKIIVAVIRVAIAVIKGIWAGIKAIVGFVRSAFNAVKSFISGAINKVKSIVSTGLTTVVGFFKKLPGRITSAFGNVGKALFNKGKDIIQGLINGIKNMAGKIAKALISILPGPIKKFAHLLGLASPSKLFDKFGRWTVEGYVQGIDKKRSTITPAMQRMADTAILPSSGFASPRLGGVAPASSGMPDMPIVDGSQVIGYLRDVATARARIEIAANDHTKAVDARFAKT